MNKREREMLADIGNKLLMNEPEPFKLFEKCCPMYGIRLTEKEYAFAERFLAAEYEVQYKIGKVAFTEKGRTWRGVFHTTTKSGKKYALVEVPHYPAELLVWRAHIKTVIESAILFRGKYSDYANEVNTNE